MCREEGQGLGPTRLEAWRERDPRTVRAKGMYDGRTASRIGVRVGGGDDAGGRMYQRAAATWRAVKVATRTREPK